MRERLAEWEKKMLTDLAGAAVQAPGSVPTDEWVDLSVAADRFGYGPEGFLKHVKNNGIGKKVGGRWKVDMVRARAWREDRPYTPL